MGEKKNKWSGFREWRSEGTEDGIFRVILESAEMEKYPCEGNRGAGDVLHCL